MVRCARLRTGVCRGDGDGMTDSAKYVVIAALEREVAGLVTGWKPCRIEGLKSCWQRGEFAVVVVGMGWERAFLGTKVAVEAFHPELVTSIGFSGSLSTELVVGDIFIPAQVVGFKNGVAHTTGFGRGTLITASGVVGVREKAEMAGRYGAQAVDMEAAAVAEAAKANGARFASLRAISDGVDDEMDFVGAFVTPEGFKAGAFLTHVAMRPRLWKALGKLASNTTAATRSLTAALQSFISGPERYLTGDSKQHPPENVSGIGQSARK